MGLNNLFLRQEQFRRELVEHPRSLACPISPRSVPRARCPVA
jgi:hypothetical protein